MRNRVYLSLLALAFIGAGCDSTSNHSLKLEASQAALTTTNNIETNLTNLSDVLQFLEEFALMQKGYHAVDGEMMCSASGEFDPETGLPIEGAEETCEFVYSEEDLEVDMDEMAADVVKMLNDYVFVDSQIEEEAGTQVVYLLKPDVFCNMVKEGEDSPEPLSGAENADSEYPMPEGEEESSEFEDCQEMLQKVPVRLRFTSQSEGDIEVDVLLGEERALALHLEFKQDTLAAELDLGSFKDAVDVLNEALGEEGDVPVQMLAYQGVLRAELKRLSADQFRMTLSVLEPIKEEVVLDGQTFKVQIGSGSVEAVADRAAKTVTLTSSLGAISLVFPYQFFIDAWYDDEEVQTPTPVENPIPADSIGEPSETPQVSGSMSLTLPGLTFQGTLAETNETFVLTNVGFGNGAVTLARNSDTLVSLELNSDAGHAFDLEVGLSQQETVVVTVQPKFDLVLAWALNLVAADLDEVPEGMGDETWRVTLDGAAKPQVEFLDGDNNDWLKVLAGQLVLSSTAASDQTVTAAQGQCLSGQGDVEDTPKVPTRADDIESAEHPFLSAFSAGTCQ